MKCYYRKHKPKNTHCFWFKVWDFNISDIIYKIRNLNKKPLPKKKFKNFKNVQKLKKIENLRYQKKIQKIKNQKKKKSKNFKRVIFLLQKREILKEKKVQQKKDSLFLNIRNMRFDQSSPVQPDPEKKIWKIFLFFFFFKTSKNIVKKIPPKKKKCFSLSFAN